MNYDIYNEKVYKETDSSAQRALDAIGINSFRYYPKEKLLVNSDTTIRNYQCDKFVPNMPQGFADAYVCAEDREICCELYERVENGEQNATAIYRIHNNVTVKVTLIIVTFDAYGKTEEVIGIVENISERLQKEREFNERLTEYSARLEKEKLYRLKNKDLIRGLSSEYQSVYLVDLENDTIEVIHRINEKKQKLYVTLTDKVENFSKAMKRYAELVVKEEDKENFALLSDISYIRTQIVEEDSSIDINYIQLTNETHFFQAKMFNAGKGLPVSKVVMGIRCVDELVKGQQQYQKRLEEANTALRLSLSQEEQYKQTLQERMDIIQVLSQDYTSIYLLNLVNGSVEPYRLSKKNERDYGESFSKNIKWDSLLQDYVSRYVQTEYKERMLNIGLTANLRALLEIKEVIEFEYKNDREGEQHFYLMKAARMAGDNINFAVVGFADVNEAREREIRIQKAMMSAYDAANAANQAKSEFLSRMSHDIRTPMNAIIGMTAIAGLHLNDPEKVEDCLQKIMVSSTHLLSLINEVLDMSKIESGKIEISEEEFNLVDLIDNMLTMVRLQVKQKNHNFNVNISNVEHEKVIGDSLRIQQAFMNLVSNAIKYTPENGNITINISEKPTRQPKLGCYEFVFEDNGIGMSKDFLKIIFEPFARANDSRVDKIQGTGLGMAITRNIVRMMGGDIKVESDLGIGSKFTVTIFLKLQDADEVDMEDFGNLPVLVVDDDTNSCESACAMLDELGMKSEWATSGKEAVIRVEGAHKERKDFFAVIIDWKMPEMDGVVTTREIRKIVGKEIPIIIISAYDWSEIEQEARAAGANAFISKPLFKSRLVHLFKGLVGKEQQEEKELPLVEFNKMNFSDKKVLLVEDNELNAEIAQEIIEMTGIMVERVEDGKQAVDRLAEVEDGYYDLVFMDIQMPVMNGHEATRKIRACDRMYLKNIPIIAMTANAFAEDVQAAINSGMNEHIAKPLEFSTLAKVLMKWIPV
ncbi:MAG: response regulator [Clostridiales bacterium]|nr:response regulator [Clostridiales bacterium]